MIEKSIVENILKEDIARERIGEYEHLSFTTKKGNNKNGMLTKIGAEGFESCNITAWISGGDPVFLKEVEKDKRFMLHHELSHCDLGLNILSKDIWIINIPEKEEVTNILKKNTYSIKAYHELYADSFSVLYLYSKDLLSISDVVDILEKREQQCIGKDSTCDGYLIHKAKWDLFSLLKSDSFKGRSRYELSIVAHYIAQKTLLRHIKEIIEEKAL